MEKSTSMIQVTVEFIGLARILTRLPKLELSVKPGTTYRDIIGAVANKFPALLGQVISLDGKELLGTNMISINGRHMIVNNALDESPDDGDKIIFMSILAGG